MGEPVTLFEVGPRDGLQNEARLIETGDKIALIDALSACGLRRIEATSFVSPKWVPQMADAAEVLAGISRPDGVRFTALTPNMRGFEAAILAGADEVAVFASASEGFSQKNINCSIAESLTRFAPVLVEAQKRDIPVRGYVSCVTDCPYDGPVAPAATADVATALIDMGCYEVSLGDTIGAGTPATIGRMLDAVCTEIAAERLAGHYHNTNGQALDNIEVSLDYGLRVFDGAVGGLGGCPYAPGAQGNVATEAVAHMLEARGFNTGVDLDALHKIADFARTLRSDT